MTEENVAAIFGTEEQTRTYLKIGFRVFSARRNSLRWGPGVLIAMHTRGHQQGRLSRQARSDSECRTINGIRNQLAEGEKFQCLKLVPLKPKARNYNQIR